MVCVWPVDIRVNPNPVYTLSCRWENKHTYGYVSMLKYLFSLRYASSGLCFCRPPIFCRRPTITYGYINAEVFVLPPVFFIRTLFLLAADPLSSSNNKSIFRHLGNTPSSLYCLIYIYNALLNCTGSRRRPRVGEREYVCICVCVCMYFPAGLTRSGIQ